MSKRLLILHQAFVAGGAELTTMNLIDGLDRSLFCHVTLVCPEVMTRYWTQGYEQWVDSIPLGLAGWFDTPARLWQDARRLSLLLREQPVDLAVGMMHYSATVLALAIRMAGARTRLLASYRGPVFEHLQHFELSIWRRTWIKTAICLGAHAADGVTMPSHGIAQELHHQCRVPSRRLHVIFNGINLDDAQRRAQQHIDFPPGLREGEFALVAARLSEEKRLHWVIQAYALLGEHFHLKLLILGDGPARPELEVLCQQLGLNHSHAARVIFHGQVDDPLPYMARASMFIHTCQYEGFGYSILEALSCGTPVIATDCPYGPREVLHDVAHNDYAGLLVDMNDPVQLATAMQRLCKDEQLRAKLAARGRQRAMQLNLGVMQTEHRRLMRHLMNE